MWFSSALNKCYKNARALITFFNSAFNPSSFFSGFDSRFCSGVDEETAPGFDRSFVFDFFSGLDFLRLSFCLLFDSDFFFFSATIGDSTCNVGGIEQDPNFKDLTDFDPGFLMSFLVTSGVESAFLAPSNLVSLEAGAGRF